MDVWSGISISGSQYKGDLNHGRMEGKGKFAFPDGTYYSGEMKDGQFHGQGTLYFKGAGSYEATWVNGKAVDGRYTFSDGLQYELPADAWPYCTGADRRFFTEMLRGIRPAGSTQLTNNPAPNNPAPNIPRDSFDVGDGYYKPSDGSIYSYAGAFVRVPDVEEAQWIVVNCRQNHS